MALISAIQAVQLHENKYSKGKVAGIMGRVAHIMPTHDYH